MPDCPACGDGEIVAINGGLCCLDCETGFYAGDELQDVLDLLEAVVEPHAGAAIDPNGDDVERATDLLGEILKGGDPS